MPNAFILPHTSPLSLKRDELSKDGVASNSGNSSDAIASDIQLPLALVGIAEGLLVQVGATVGKNDVSIAVLELASQLLVVDTGTESKLDGSESAGDALGHGLRHLGGVEGDGAAKLAGGVAQGDKDGVDIVGADLSEAGVASDLDVLNGAILQSPGIRVAVVAKVEVGVGTTSDDNTVAGFIQKSAAVVVLNTGVLLLDLVAEEDLGLAEGSRVGGGDG